MTELCLMAFGAFELNKLIEINDSFLGKKLECAFFGKGLMFIKYVAEHDLRNFFR